MCACCEQCDLCIGKKNLKSSSKLHICALQGEADSRGEKRLGKLLGKNKFLEQLERKEKQNVEQTNSCTNSECLTDPKWNQPNQPQTNTHTRRAAKSLSNLIHHYVRNSLVYCIYVRNMESDFVSERARIVSTDTEIKKSVTSLLLQSSE